MNKKLTPARLNWTEDHTPYCDEYDDIYFTRQGGIEESKAVFLEGNKLPERWLDRARFCIAEAGFGTGLNFLVSADCWLKTARHDAQLYYISIEKHPINKQDLAEIYSKYPQFNVLSTQLLQHYPNPNQGYHSITLNQGKIHLTLIFDDIESALGEFIGKADAWYLDGFSPQKNPQMWSQSVFKKIQQRTAVNGTFSTYTAAGFVRRQLEQCGFIVSKVKGFGKKRERLIGTLASSDKRQPLPPWYALPETKYQKKKATIIGAGIAGCSMAFLLAELGWQISLIETASTPADGGSGNPKGIFYPKLTADHNAQSRFYLAGFLFAKQILLKLIDAGLSVEHDFCGVTEQHFDKKTEARQSKIFDRFTGIQRIEKGLHYPDAGWLNPRQFCQALLSAYPQQIKISVNQTIDRIIKENQDWQLYRGTTLIETSPILILANSYQAQQFSQCQSIPIDKIRGQISFIPDTSQSRKTNNVLCGKGYIIPSCDSLHITGASYEADGDSLELSQSSQDENLQQACQLEHSLQQHQHLPLQGRASFRGTTPDHLPIVGAVADTQAFNQDYFDIQHGKPDNHYPQARYHDGLFITAGHGSKGITSSLISAKILCALIENTPLPVERTVYQAIHPARFLIRQMKKDRPPTEPEP
jgi:tRNA 5-methylaminomethyl-2-thiouridine biosynthesis bifunctional protein